MTASTTIPHTGLQSNPFPGLRSFLDSESHLFFGRKTHVKEVRDKLEQNHFVAIVGTSGTGKSSLVRAGLLPSMHKELNKEGEPLWRLITITPGGSPLQNLANAISHNLGGSQNPKANTETILSLLKESSLGLVQAIRPLLPPGERLLLLVDQFEEVFRFSDEAANESKALYDAFVQIITDTVRQRDVPVYAILTLRSDFLGDCVDYEGLPEAINDGHYLVPRMNQQQLREAITGPVDMAKGKISPRLIQHIHQHLGHNADQLPVLQHAMMRTWDYWTAHTSGGEPIDLKHFEAVGGLGNALSSHADEAFGELDSKQQELVEQLFKCLTTKQADNRGVRRPLSLEELASITSHTEAEVLACLKPFRKAGRSFILPGLEVAAHSDTIFDISHESLMRGWKRLTAWVDEEMESAELYERICTAALLHKRGASALWRNPELQLALDWKERQQPSTAWAALYNPHLEASLVFLKASEDAHREERRRKRQRTVIVRSAVVTFVVVVSILAAWAMNQTRIAEAKTVETELKKIEALEQKGLAETAREEALKASELAEAARLRAEEQATIAEAQERIAQEERSKAQLSAMRALKGEEQALAQKELADQQTRLAEIQKLKADSAKIESQRLRLIATGQKLAFESAQISQNPELAGLLAITSYDLAKTNGGRTNDGTLYAAAAKAMRELSPEHSSVVMRHNESLMALNVGDGKLNYVDQALKAASFQLPDFSPIQNSSLRNLGKSPDRIFILAGGKGTAIAKADYSIQFDNHEGAYGGMNPAIGHTDLVRAAVAPTHMGEVYTGGRDRQFIHWKSDGSMKMYEFPSRIRTLTLVEGGEYDCLIGCENGKVYSFRARDGQRETLLARAGSRVETIAVSQSGNYTAIGYSDGVVQLLKGRNPLKEIACAGSISHLCFDEQRDILAVATAGKQLNLYALSSLSSLPISITLERSIEAMDLDNAAGDLYVYTNDRALQRFPVLTESLIDNLQGKIKRKLSFEEWNTFLGDDIPYPYGNGEQTYIAQ